MAVDDTWQLQMRGGGTEGGNGGGGRGLLVDATAVGGCDKRGEEEAAVAAVGGAMRKQKWCVLCFYCTFLGKASSIGHPPHSWASPVELRLWVGPRALSEKKNLGNKG